MKVRNQEKRVGQLLPMWKERNLWEMSLNGLSVYPLLPYQGTVTHDSTSAGARLCWLWKNYIIYMLGRKDFTAIFSSTEIKMRRPIHTVPKYECFHLWVQAQNPHVSLSPLTYQNRTLFLSLNLDSWNNLCFSVDQDQSKIHFFGIFTNPITFTKMVNHPVAPLDIRCSCSLWKKAWSSKY